MPFSRRSLKCHILSGVFGLSLLISRVFCKHGIEESLKLSWSERGIVNPEVVGSTPAKIPKTEKSNLHVFELHRPSSKGTKLLFHVLKATINQGKKVDTRLRNHASSFYSTITHAATFNSTIERCCVCAWAFGCVRVCQSLLKGRNQERKNICHSHRGTVRTLNPQSLPFFFSSLFFYLSLSFGPRVHSCWLNPAPSLT